MDLLDRVHPIARGLLARVDATLLSSGAPDDHRIWPLLRRLGGLPGEAADRLAELAPEALSAAAGPLRDRADGYRSWTASVPAVAAWRGPAAEGFAARWSTLAGHLAGDEETMAGRLVDTARYLEDVAAWLARGRRELAGALAECLGSAEAATLHAAPAGLAAGGEVRGGVAPSAGAREVVLAAATLGAHVLATVADVVDGGQRILDAWRGRLDELRYPVTVPNTAPVGGQLEIG
jgi:hypothetical protein